MRFYKNTLLAGSLSAALVLGACSTASASDDMEWTSEDNAGVAKDKTEETSEFEYSAQDAVDLAGERFDGIVTDVELDEDDGVHYYEIEMENGEDEYDVDINAEDLSIIEEDLDREDDEDREAVKEQQAEKTKETDSNFIGMEKAVQIAKDAVGGGEVDEKEFDRDDNEYDIEIHRDGSEYEVEINATTGEVKDSDADNEKSEGDFLSSEEAGNIALEAAGGGEVEESDLDKDDNEYDIEIAYDVVEYEVELDATTGEVLDVEKDD